LLLTSTTHINSILSCGNPPRSSIPRSKVPKFHYCATRTFMINMKRIVTFTTTTKLLKTPDNLASYHIYVGLSHSKPPFMVHLFPLPHTYSLKEGAIALMTSKTAYKVESFSHVKLVTTAMRTGKPDWSIWLWQPFTSSSFSEMDNVVR